jgi:hypothetical protein
MQARDTGKITATPAETAPGGADNTLPDPTTTAKWSLLLLGLLAVIAALALNWFKVTPPPDQVFDPSADPVANFALFAGFYIVAQVIAGVLALVGPLLPPWKPPSSLTDEAVKAAQTKADRSALLLGAGALLGVILSCTLGLFFLKAVGMHVSHTVDAIFTGATLAGGAKPLSDFIALTQNKTAPATGTGDGT